MICATLVEIQTDTHKQHVTSLYVELKISQLHIT